MLTAREEIKVSKNIFIEDHRFKLQPYPLKLPSVGDLNLLENKFP